MDLSEIMTMPELLKEVVSTVSCGGNALINVGPTKEGTIAPIFQERLLALGRWLEVNGEAIYGTSPWYHQNDTTNQNVWYTCTKDKFNAHQPTAVPDDDDSVTAVYAVFLNWPKQNVLVMSDIVSYLHAGTPTVTMLGSDASLNWKINKGVAFISLPDKATVKSEDAWSLKFSN